MAILSSKSKSGWASLPEDVLGLILDYLVPMEDYLAFSEVCNQWEDAVREKLEELRCNRKRHCCLHQQVPLLLAPSPSRDNTRNRFCLFDVMKGKSVFEFELRIEQPENWRFEGSSHGWLILFNIVSFEVNLFNPFSGETIRLPPLKNSTFCLASSGPVNYLIIPSKRRRCVLSMDTLDVVNNNNNNNDNEVVLMMTCKASEQRIAFIKLGDQHWSYVHELRDSEDIACIINGVFYIVDKFGVPFSARVNYSYDNHQQFYKLRWIPSSGHHGRPQSESEYYLVESPEGDLLRVVKIQNKTMILFMIYKLIWFSKNPRWEEVTELGDVALFLGDNHSISVKASAFPGCKRNSIYFCHYAGHFFSVHGSVHVFSLTNRTTTLLYGHFGQHVLWISSKFL